MWGTRREWSLLQIWTVCSSRKEDIYVTGGSDGRIVMWEDATEAIAQEEMKKHVEHQHHLQVTLFFFLPETLGCSMIRLDESVLQSLENMLADGRYTEALQYALGLDRPHCALKVYCRLGRERRRGVL